MNYINITDVINELNVFIDVLITLLLCIKKMAYFSEWLEGTEDKAGNVVNLSQIIKGL